jgi:hypothetical protein
VEGSSGTNTMTYTRGSRYSFWNFLGWALRRSKHVGFDVGVNKCLHTDASSWSFLLILKITLFLDITYCNLNNYIDVSSALAALIIRVGLKYQIIDL